MHLPEPRCPLLGHLIRTPEFPDRMVQAQFQDWGDLFTQTLPIMPQDSQGASVLRGRENLDLLAGSPIVHTCTCESENSQFKPDPLPAESFEDLDGVMLVGVGARVLCGQNSPSLKWVRWEKSCGCHA